MPFDCHRGLAQWSLTIPISALAPATLDALLEVSRSLASLPRMPLEWKGRERGIDREEEEVEEEREEEIERPRRSNMVIY